MSKTRVILSRLLITFLGGVLATLPMTLWMLWANNTVSTAQPDPLPPEAITKNLIEKTGQADALEEGQKKQLSLINHFLYGGAIALPYAIIPASVRTGLLYGLLVWVANYLGLLPKLHLYPSAKNEPLRMNALMILAHLIWGFALAIGSRSA